MVESSIGRFACQDCPERFGTFHGLQQHTAQHTWGPHKIVEDENGKRFLCMYPGCSKVILSNRKVLRKHLISHQKPTHFCGFPGCKRAFHEKSKLKRHQLVHSGEKNYVCEFPECGKLFAYKANMKTHMRTHTGQRPFKCNWPGCGRTFTQASNRSTHMKVHRRSCKRKAMENDEESWELRLPSSHKKMCLVDRVAPVPLNQREGFMDGSLNLNKGRTAVFQGNSPVIDLKAINMSVPPVVLPPSPTSIPSDWISTFVASKLKEASTVSYGNVNVPITHMPQTHASCTIPSEARFNASASSLIQLVQDASRALGYFNAQKQCQVSQPLPIWNGQAEISPCPNQ